MTLNRPGTAQLHGQSTGRRHFTEIRNPTLTDRKKIASSPEARVMCLPDSKAARPLIKARPSDCQRNRPVECYPRIQSFGTGHRPTEGAEQSAAGDRHVQYGPP